MNQLALLSNSEKLSHRVLETIDKAVKFEDISKTVKNLFSIDELKLLCKQQLNKLNKNKNINKIRKTYLNTNPLHHTISSDLTVKVFKYLPSSNYKILPCVSKSIQNLINNKANILFSNYALHLTLFTTKRGYFNESDFEFELNHDKKNLKLRQKLMFAYNPHQNPNILRKFVH